MNEFEETLRIINSDIAVHKKQIMELDTAMFNLEHTYFDSEFDFDSEKLLHTTKKAFDFKKKFHEHKIEELSKIRDELMNKYHLKDE